MILANLNNVKIRVDLKSESTLDFYCPKVALVNEISANKTEIIYMREKYTLGVPIGEVKVEFKVGDEAIEKVEKKTEIHCKSIIIYSMRML